MTPDYTFNHTGPAHHNFDGSFITHFIFAAFLLLFTIPIHVQVATIYDRLRFHRQIRALFKIFSPHFSNGLRTISIGPRVLQLVGTRTQIAGTHTKD